MALFRRAALLAVSGVALSSIGLGYYHYTHFAGASGPFQPIYEKYDLNALPNKTINFFISDQTPTLAPADSVAGLISQVRLAAKVWNDVDGSDIRVAFGGMESSTTVQNSPGIDVVFDDLPPGLVALGGPTVRADLSNGLGQFVPILRSKLVVSRDLTQRPSYGEAFFNTVVHEFGHTLGLQHTLTSGVMATEVTRDTTKADPITADDIAGLTLLYPSRVLGTGSITGRVTLNDGTGVNLASVVALQPNGVVISALSYPDGTYRIDGLPPGQYLVYTHPLPPPLAGEVTPANIVLPVDAQGRPIPVGPSFGTVFYPGVHDWTQALAVPVQAGSAAPNINFSVQRQAAPALYAVQTSTNLGSISLKPPFLNFNADRAWIWATGVGLTVNNRPAPGLAVSVIGGSANVVPNGIQAFSSQFISIDFQFPNPFSAPQGPRHLVFSLNNDIYVLPGAFEQVQTAPPSIKSATAGFDSSGNRVVTLTGANLMPDTRVLFDGQLATVRSSAPDFTQTVVTPPPGAAGYRATVVALNSDGQSSLFLQGANPPTYTYDAVDTQPLNVSQLSLPAGVDAMLDVLGSNFDSTTVIGFGSSDVVVRKSWVLNSNHIVLNVHVNPGATPGPTDLSATAGFQVTNLPLVFQVLPANNRLLDVTGVANQNGGAGLQAGGNGILTYTNAQFPLSVSNVQLSVGGLPAQVLLVGPGQIVFQVPASLTPGPVAVRLQAGTDFIYPIAAQIDPVPPVITSVLLPGGTAADATHPAHPGDMILLQVGNLGDSVANLTPAHLTMNVAGLDHPAVSVAAALGLSGTAQAIFVLSPQAATGSAVPVTINVDGRISSPYSLNISR